MRLWLWPRCDYDYKVPKNLFSSIYLLTLIFISFQVANDLYEALQQFFLLFPELQKNEFYATGESYAGKYVPAISYKVCFTRNLV